MSDDTVTLTHDEMAQYELLVEQLEEAALDAERMLAADSRGWMLPGDEEGVFRREDVKRTCNLARVMAVRDPLIRRAVSLHKAYVFGEGVTVAAQQEEDAEQDVNAVVQGFLGDPSNAKAWSSAQAREDRERRLQTDGEMFHALITAPLSGRVQVRVIPPLEVTDIIANPEDADEVWYYRRTFVAKTLVASSDAIVTKAQESTVYYPALGWRPATRPRSIDGFEVRWDSPVVHTLVNPSAGRGVPDLLAALPWAAGYKEFLEDWARIAKALSRFAFRATAKSKAGAAAARAKIASAGEAGATAITGEGQTLEAIGKSGATIDANSGLPLAAMVASATNIPVTMLTANPGVTGARATAETLDTPLENVIRTRRTLHAWLERTVAEYVVHEAIRAPQGALKGKVTRDPATGVEVFTLAGDQSVSVEVSFPPLDKTDVATIMAALKTADDMDILPELLVAKLVMTVLDVDDPEEWLDQITDGDGHFQRPSDATSARSQRAQVATGDLPKD